MMTATNHEGPTHYANDPHNPPTPVPVRATAQNSLRAQRSRRYAPESLVHPDKMLSAIAGHAISVYTSPGDLVIDPMCGTGTTLMEAIRADRTAIGVEHEKRRADMALRNIQYATDHGAPGYAAVICGDARRIEQIVGSDVHGRAALVLTSPPLYGPATHGRISTDRNAGTRKVECDPRYDQDPASPTCADVDLLMDGFRQILAGCRALLRPDGYLVITARPFRRIGTLVDVPAVAAQAAVSLGFTLHNPCAALPADARDNGIEATPSLFQLVSARNGFSPGQPTLLAVPEELVVLRMLSADGVR